MVAVAARNYSQEEWERVWDRNCPLALDPVCLDLVLMAGKGYSSVVQVRVLDAEASVLGIDLMCRVSGRWGFEALAIDLGSHRCFPLSHHFPRMKAVLVYLADTFGTLGRYCMTIEMQTQLMTTKKKNWNSIQCFQHFQRNKSSQLQAGADKWVEVVVDCSRSCPRSSPSDDTPNQGLDTNFRPQEPVERILDQIRLRNPMTTMKRNYHHNWTEREVRMAMLDRRAVGLGICYRKREVLGNNWVLDNSDRRAQGDSGGTNLLRRHRSLLRG